MYLYMEIILPADLQGGHADRICKGGMQIGKVSCLLCTYIWKVLLPICKGGCRSVKLAACWLPIYGNYPSCRSARGVCRSDLQGGMQIGKVSCLLYTYIWKVLLPICIPALQIGRFSSFFPTYMVNRGLRSPTDLQRGGCRPVKLTIFLL